MRYACAVGADRACGDRCFVKLYREVEVAKWIFGGDIQVMADVADNVIGKCFSMANCLQEDFLAEFFNISQCLFFRDYLIRQVVK
jgi:hypothetical protein